MKWTTIPMTKCSRTKQRSNYCIDSRKSDRERIVAATIATSIAMRASRMPPTWTLKMTKMESMPRKRWSNNSMRSEKEKDEKQSSNESNGARIESRGIETCAVRETRICCQAIRASSRHEHNCMTVSVNVTDFVWRFCVSVTAPKKHCRCRELHQNIVPRHRCHANAVTVIITSSCYRQHIHHVDEQRGQIDGRRRQKVIEI
mmetsp:Transcript_43617/g.69889  ORF Transcript_43617/g.69889 Transcript_43617/m.69889 type:complete len:202 (-) Transcript_43617:1736-2341(-)